MLDLNHSHGFKGIKVNISDDGEMNYETEAIIVNPFEEMAQLLAQPLDAESLARGQALCRMIPDPARPETWVNSRGLEILKKFWAAEEKFNATGNL
jgi:hypothetical protein